MSDFDLVSIDGYAEPKFGVQIKGPHAIRIHPESVCKQDENACVIHSPSEHHMRSWPMNWRADRLLMERICPHGVGHPDPDDLAFHVRNDRKWQGVHGCDGCCHKQHP